MRYTQFVYNSTTPSGSHVYNDWVQLMAELDYVGVNARANATITFQKAETIPAGRWDLTDVTLRGNGIGYAQSITDCVYVTVPTGCTFTNNVLRVDAGLVLESTSLAPVMTPTGSASINVDGAATLASSTAAFVRTSTDLAVVAVSVGGGGQLAGAGLSSRTGGVNNPSRPIGGYELVEDASANGAILALTAYGLAYLDKDLLRGTAYLYVTNCATPSVVLPTEFAGQPLSALTHANLSATPYPSVATSGALIGYTPADTSKWTGADPTTLAAAVDRIAAALGPIA